MSSDSLFGGGDGAGGDDGGGLLDAEDRALLDSLLADYVGDPAVDFDGGQLLNGKGFGGEWQGALTPGTGELEGPITNGEITMEVDIPAGTGLTFSGKDGQTGDAAESYLNTAIGGYFSPNVDPNSDAGQQQQSLTGAVDDLLGSLGGGKDISVRLIDFLGKTSPGTLTTLTTLTSMQALLSEDTVTLSQGSGLTTSELVLDAGTSAGKQVFAVNMANLNKSTALVLENLEGAILAAPGTVRVDNAAGTRVYGDLYAQDVTGGSGNDTLVGGGNDTLAGGAGADVFGFNTMKGHIVITDFNKAADKIGVEFAGVSTIAQLNALITKAYYANGSMTYELGPDMSVTLVGVAAFDVTAAMINFTV